MVFYNLAQTFEKVKMQLSVLIRSLMSCVHIETPRLISPMLAMFYLSYITILSARVCTSWVRRYNGPGNYWDSAFSLKVDGAGNVYVTGYGWCGSSTWWDYITIKYNPTASGWWVARYNGPGILWDYAASLAVDDSGNVYVTGTSYVSGDDYDYATVKYNQSSIEQWVARYNGPGNLGDWAKSIAVDCAGNIYVAGGSDGSGTYSDFATVKYNRLGIEQWIARYNGPGNGDDRARSIVVDGVDNIYVTGESFGGITDYDYATIKYNSSGIEQWLKRYNGLGNGTDKVSAMAVDDSGNVYVTGYSWGLGTDYDYVTIEYDTLGILQWVARYNGMGDSVDMASSIVVDDSGNVYVTGTSYVSGDDYDYATVKYNQSGIEQWVARYNGPGNGDDRASSIAVDDSSNVYVTGYSYGLGTYNDYTSIKYNSSGIEQWVVRYNGPGNSLDEPNSIVVDHLGNVYVTGRSFGSGTDYDYATIKYAPLPPFDIDVYGDSLDVKHDTINLLLKPASPPYAKGRFVFANTDSAHNPDTLDGPSLEDLDSVRAPMFALRGPNNAVIDSGMVFGVPESLKIGTVVVCSVGVFIQEGSPPGTYTGMVTIKGHGKISLGECYDTFFVKIDGPYARPNLDSLRVFPIPFKPLRNPRHHAIYFYGLTNDTWVRVYDIAGAKVWEHHETDGDGCISWNATKDGDDIANGIYIYYIATSTGEKRKGKLSIIR